tara:strand:- start:349 stop:993 length:645 start_codon:yes stop_codon:yes gene_type:complete
VFSKNGYEVKSDVIHKDVLELIYNYYQIKIHNSEFDLDAQQVPGTITMYGDTLNDAILKWTLPIAESVIGEELYPCYTFLRIYNKGDILEPHCDRPSCEFSATLPIYFDKKWPIMMQKYDFEKYGPEGFEESARSSPSKSIILEMGDMCFYSGTTMNHWRLPFSGYECVQLFIHYVRKNGEFSEYKYDKRKFLGLPSKTEDDRKSEYLDSFFDD